MPTMRLESASYSTIRSTNRKGQRCGISASISRVVWMVSVTDSSRAGRGQCGGSAWRHTSRSVQVCTTTFRDPPGSRTRRRGQEGLAPDTIEHVRRHPAREEGLVLEHRLVDGDVRDQALDHQLVECDARTGDGRRAVGPADDALPEARLVVGRNARPAEQLRLGPGPGPDWRVVALDQARP